MMTQLITMQKFSEEFDAAKEAVKAAEDELAQAKEAEPEASHHVQEFKLAICYDKKDRCEGIVQAGKHALQRCDEMMTECEDAESEVLEREELMAPRPQKKTVRMGITAFVRGPDCLLTSALSDYSQNKGTRPPFFSRCWL